LISLVESDQGLIFEIQKMSTEDGPGIRTTVFFKQCPLKCAWCHNPESILKKKQIQWISHKCIGCKTCIETCKQGALKLNKKGMYINRDKCNSCGDCVEECPSTALSMFGKLWQLDNLFYEIEKDKVYYTKSGGGITVSGGEPTLQPDFIENFLKKCKENGISTALDTCGYASRQVYEKILPHVDLVLLDIKEIDSEKHENFTSISNERILENAIWISKYIEENGKKMWIRTPMIPKYTATDENIKGIGDFIVEKLNNIPARWDLLAFNNLCSSKYERLDMEWPLKDEELMKKEEMEHFYEIAKSTGVKNPQWSGMTKRVESDMDSSSKNKETTLPKC
jgi:pyruvate formate lyase activating enzyme